MPNWCDNTLTITGNKEDIAIFKKKAKTKDTALSLNKFVSLPKELKNTTSPVKIVSAKEYPEAVKKAKEFAKKHKDFGLSLPITKTMQTTLIKKYGVDNWYNWKVNNWGTKWDINAELTDSFSDFLSYQFSSAWSPPIEWLHRVAKKYPKLRFTLKYDEQGMCYMGVAIGIKGVVTENTINY